MIVGESSTTESSKRWTLCIKSKFTKLGAVKSPKVVDVRISDGEKDTNVEVDGFSYPEGGLKAWSVTVGAMLGVLPTWGLFFVTGTVQNHISKNQLANKSISSVSWIFSIYAFLVLSSGIFSGLYFDKCGTKQPLAIGSVIFIGGLIGVGNSKTIGQFILSFSVAAGIGSGIITSPMLGCVCHYFYRRRGIATALAINGGSVGGVIFPIMFGSLFDKVGFAWSFRIMSLIAAFCLTLTWFLVREDPEKLTVTTSEQAEYVKNYHPLRRSILTMRDAFDYKALAQGSYFWGTIATSMAEVSAGTTLTYIASYCTAVHYKESDSFAIVTTLNTLTIFGGFIFSFVADRWLGAYNVMIIVNIGLAFSGLIIWLPFGSRSTSNMYIFAAIYGFFYGSMLNLAPVCCGKISKTNEFGKRYATMYVLVGLFFLLGIPISGVILREESLSAYNNLIIFVSSISGTSAFLFAVSKYYALKSPSNSAPASSFLSVILTTLFTVF
ncbi:uncharacterized protein Ecym_4357 [Eremothecium cymbalariae DBVPG|uniref:Major facilitator superfamily (MFS) profile domain-containing protein n=1 Tax=Eremothecium cymbalariae (strain CBS 270.75 / DBVPG 7215 / KCTC 17166 / NRRL Y-17582) TaxID=931890 RepID=G8JTR4_ERECY|nr:hypothetical protein Ecym_4357 [Eremothecium cymbalariae DBVPG\